MLTRCSHRTQDEELSTVDVEAHAASQVQPEQQPCQQHHQPEPQQQGQQQGQQQVRQQQERQEVEPRLMDYVRVKEGGVCCGSSEEGMPPGTEGVVLGSASKGTRLKVRGLATMAGNLYSMAGRQALSTLAATTDRQPTVWVRQKAWA